MIRLQLYIYIYIGIRRSVYISLGLQDSQVNQLAVIYGRQVMLGWFHKPP